MWIPRQAVAYNSEFNEYSDEGTGMEEVRVALYMSFGRQDWDEESETEGETKVYSLLDPVPKAAKALFISSVGLSHRSGMNLLR